MRTFGGGSEVVGAVDQLEKNSSSEGRKQIVAEELANAKADTNPELMAAAEQVLAEPQELPQGEQQHIMQTIGSYIAQADRGSSAKVTITGKSRSSILAHGSLWLRRPTLRSCQVAAAMPTS